MKRINRLLCTVLAVALFATCLPLTTFAAELKTAEEPALRFPDGVTLEYPEDHAAAPVQAATAEDLKDYLTDDFLDYMLSQFALCKTSFSIESYGIPASLDEQLQNFIWYEFPEAFHVYGLGIGDSGGSLFAIYVSYRDFADTAEEFAACNAKLQVGANELLAGIEGNNALTDVEKALLLHDRLAIWTAYDYKNYMDGTLPKTVYTAYGALGNQSAVCQGYAMAYTYLLNRVGIESDYCSSDAMNHGWNIVYIDGKPYHVDVTWDDPVWDMMGYVKHDNFLRSTAGIVETGHDGGDFITTPTSTTYDNYYWQDSRDPFVLSENELYFLDSDNVLKRADGATATVMCQIKEEGWKTQTGTWWNVTCLSAANDLIMYSAPKGIYAIDPATGTSNLVYAPDLSASEYLSIYGFKYEKGQLVCYLDVTHGHDQITESDLIRKSFAPDSTKKYTVTFKDAGGKVISTQKLGYGQIVTIPSFSPLYDANGYLRTWDKEITVCMGDATYTEISKRPNAHKVQYVDWDGTVVAVQWYDRGEHIEHPSIELYREEDDEASYTFLGWSYEGWNDSNYGQCIGDMTIKAFYQTSYKQYTVRFLNWDGSVMGESNGLFWNEDLSGIIPGAEFMERPADNRYTYEFIGWDKEVSTICKGNATYTAQYRAIPIYYTVTFVNPDGTVLSTAQYTWGKTVDVPENPTYNYGDAGYRYQFVGWDKTVTPCYRDVTYTAVYSMEAIAYTVTFKNWDGTVLSSSQYYYGDTVRTPATPQRAGNHLFNYRFTGWDMPVSVCYGDVVYTATYETEYVYYTVVFKDWDGTVISTQSCPWNGVVEIPTAPTKPADSNYTYTFSGWDKNVTACRGNATYTATYTAKPVETVKNGWVRDNGKWYYYKDNVKKSGWIKDSGYWYYMNKEGIMQTGWLKQGNTWYYLKPSGNMATGWCQVGGVYYYFDDNGYMKTGWLQQGGTWYYLKPSGAMATGWCQVGSAWYYFKASGAMVTGWLKLGSTWYYFHSSGAMATGSVKIGTKTYRFNASGACLNP